MLPLVCNDAVALLFMFDLSRKSTLNSIKEWYRQARGFNKVIKLYWVNFFKITKLIKKKGIKKGRNKNKKKENH